MHLCLKSVVVLVFMMSTSVLLFPVVLGAWTTADLRPRNYNPLRRPQASGDPVIVNVNIDLVSLLAVNEFEQVSLPKTIFVSYFTSLLTVFSC
jgi:hypothetical protein